jgi:hypothetical protein
MPLLHSSGRDAFGKCRIVGRGLCLELCHQSVAPCSHFALGQTLRLPRRAVIFVVMIETEIDEVSGIAVGWILIEMRKLALSRPPIILEEIA